MRALIERNQTIKLSGARIQRPEDVNGLFCNSISVALDHVISNGLHKIKEKKQTMRKPNSLPQHKQK